MHITIILSGITIVLLIISVVTIFFALRMKKQLKRHDNQDSPATLFAELLQAKFSYIVYNSDLRIAYIQNDQPEILLDFTSDKLIGTDIRELDKFVSPENRLQARTITANILLAAQEKKNRYFEYTSTNSVDNKVYYALCFIIYRKDGTLCACATMVDEKNIFQAREHLYNTEINPAIGQVSVGIYVRSVAREKKYEMFNVMAQHFYGTNDVLHSHSWNQEEEDHYDELVLSSDQSVFYEKPVVNKEGNIGRWLQVIKQKKARQEEDGFYITTTLLDVTQRKKEEAELIVTRQNLELAIGAADISIWRYQCDKRLFSLLYGKIQFLAGITYDSLIRSVPGLYQSDFAAAFDRLLDCTSDKEVAICEFHDEEAETNIYYEIQMTVSEKDAQGKVRAIVGTLKDITYQYIYKRELENQENKIQLAIQTSNLVQWEYNNVTRLFNSNNERIKSNETVLTSEDYCRAVHPDDQEKVRQIIEMMNEGRDETFLFNKRLKYSDDNSWHYTTVNGVPFAKDRNGKVIKYTGFRRDDTEWKNINERLEQEKRKAQKADKLKSAFLANMSHEIRTPLNAIVGFSELLLTTDDFAEKEEYTHIIKVNNELLLRLVSDILDLSKIESGMLELQREEFDIVPFFDDLMKSLAQRATNPEVKFLSVNPYRKCIVTLDKNRMAQIFTNFTINAIKYTPRGYIKTGYEYTDKGIRIYAEDSGIGIPEEKQERIFQRFEKLDDFAHGTGLGLSICKAIINAIGGKIGFTSEPGKGSTFWAWLECDPYIEYKETPDHDKAESLNSGQAAAPIHHNTGTIMEKHILIAEDNDSNYMLLESILKNNSLVRAYNGIEAVEKAQADNYAIILMDIRMPRMDGLEATRKIREFNKHIPIVAVTANAFDSDKVSAFEAGCNDFISKPVKKSELLATINRLTEIQ